MVTCTQGHCTFETQAKDADAVLLCGDCIGCFPMTRQGRDLWIVRLDLPLGHHHFRYYGRYGQTMLWLGEDDIVIQNSIHL